MQVKSIYEKIFSAFEENNFDPRIELNYSNDFTLLVAVVLSAQATDKKVNEVTKHLFPKFDSPQKMYSLGIEGLKKYIKSIGLYNNKAKNIIALSYDLMDKFDSIVPSNFSDLVSLPGVGRKSANVILNTLFEEEVMPVDTHVFRVSRRIGITDSTNLLKVEKDILSIVPKKFLKRANQWLVLHGRYICKAKKPLCDKCIISKYCKYYNAL